MSADTQPTFDGILTMRKADMVSPEPGSIDYPCSLCDATVVLAPATLVVFAQAGIELPPVWCLQCYGLIRRRGGRA